MTSTSLEQPSPRVSARASGRGAEVIVERLSGALLLIAAVVLAFYVGVYFVYAINLIGFPFDYDQGEGFELVDVLMLSEGRWPYQDIEAYPFYGSIYPPVYHVLLIPFAWVFGPEYWYGRLFSFITTLITAAAIAYAVNRESKHRWIALVAGMAFLSSNIVYHIGPLFRQHIPMILFETLAIVVLAHVNEIADQQRRRRQLALGMALLILAGYTKQLAAFSAIAALLFLFIRQPRRAIIWGAGFAAVGAAIFVWLTWATDGHWWTQTIVANVKDFDPAQAIGLLRQWFNLHGFLLIPALAVIVYELYFDRLSIYSLWLPVNAALNAISAGTWGAGDSYYATSIAAVCVLSGIFAARTLNRTWTFQPNVYSRALIDPLRRYARPIRMAGLILVPLLYLGYARSVLHMPTTGPVFGTIADVLDLTPNAINGFYDSAGRVTGGYADIGHLTTRADRSGGELILDRVRAIPDDVPILSEEAAFSLLTGREVITNPVVLYILDQVGQVDSSGLVAMLERQEFGLIILRARFYPPTVNIAIDTYYEPVETILMNGFDYVLLRPRDEAPERGS